MFSKRLQSGDYVGTGTNCLNKGILLQCEESGEQVRIVLTIPETLTLIEDLQRQLEKLKEPKDAI